MKKYFSFFLAVVVVLGTFSIPISAINEQADTSEITSVTQSFLQQYTEYSRMYEDVDLTENTVLDVGVPMLMSGKQAFTLSSGDATLADIQDNIGFIEKKAEYFKEARVMQDITRTDLELTYNFDSITINGNSATVEVSELASFFYTGETKQTFVETNYTVDLIQVGGRWVVADATDNDWFDYSFKDDSDFSVQAELSTLEDALAAESVNVFESVDDNMLSPMSVGTYQIPYNGENAAAYAYTYSRAGRSDWDNYYNHNFAEWRSSDGADCMNFASQSMYAGFSGDDIPDSIDAHNQPMDYEEGATYQWYSCSRDADSWYGNSYPSWRSCSNFRLYLTGNTSGTGTTGSNAATDVGMKAQVLSIASGAAITGTTASKLIGAVGHVLSGTGDPYGHAIVLTDASGLARNQIYYCAHTSDTKYEKLGDHFTGVMKVIIPEYFRTDKSSADYLKVNMLRPVAVNTTSALKCYTTAAQYKFTITVQTPSGVQTQTSASNTTSCTYNYKFAEKGDYTVTCYSKSTSSATAERVTFRVTVY